MFKRIGLIVLSQLLLTAHAGQAQSEVCQDASLFGENGNLMVRTALLPSQATQVDAAISDMGPPSFTYRLTWIRNRNGFSEFKVHTRGDIASYLNNSVEAVVCYQRP